MGVAKAKHDPLRAARVRSVVEQLGGNRAAAQKSGLRLGTLNGYLAGGEMKLSNAAALARTAGVNLQWLATGEGPMKVGESPTAPAAGAPRAQDVIDLDDLVVVYEAALHAFAVRGEPRPDARKLLAFALHLYDAARVVLQPPDADVEPERNP